VINNDVGGNCGVHVCTWAYIIASGSYTRFSEVDMNVARKGIASYLANSVSDKRTENKTIKSRDLILSNTEKQSISIEKLSVKSLKTSESTPFYFTNTFEFAASLHLIIENEKSQPQTRRQKT